MLPEWPDRTVTVLSTGAGPPHAITVSTAIRSGPATVHFALGLRRESLARLRDERRALVAAVSRRTGEAHRAIHGRVNRETGAASIAAASVDQLERGNRLLERQASKRR